MSMKAARGTKRACPNCGAKFYDLNRSPIVCPVCQTFYETEKVPAPAKASKAVEPLEEEEDQAVLGDVGEDVDIVPLEDVASEEEIPDIEGEDLAELESGEGDIEPDEALIAEEDDEDTDVTGIIGSPIDSDKEDEV